MLSGIPDALPFGSLRGALWCFLSTKKSNYTPLSVRRAARGEQREESIMSSVPAARDTLRIITYLAGHSGPVRAATICRDLALPRSSVYHLLRVMQDENFVVHSPEYQGYALGSLVAEIGSSVLASNNLARLATPV